MQKTIIILGLIGSVFYWSSCTYYNEQDYFGDALKDTSLNNCNSMGMTYDSVKIVFEGVCSQCHNNVSTFRGGIELDKYSSVKSSINTGKVLPAIKHEGPYKMPYGLQKLNNCEIERIEAWINDGMPE